MKKRIIIFIILEILILGLIALNIFFSVCCWQLHYNMFLNEYNAQMNAFGYYKEDIHLLNQLVEETRFVWLLIVNIISYFVLGGTFLGCLAYITYLIRGE